MLREGSLSSSRCRADCCGRRGAGLEPEGDPVDQIPEGCCSDCWRGDDAHRARGHSSPDRAADGCEPGGDSGYSQSGDAERTDCGDASGRARRAPMTEPARPARSAPGRSSSSRSALLMMAMLVRSGAALSVTMPAKTIEANLADKPADIRERTRRLISGAIEGQFDITPGD